MANFPIPKTSNDNNAILNSEGVNGTIIASVVVVAYKENHLQAANIPKAYVDGSNAMKMRIELTKLIHIIEIYQTSKAQ